MAVLHHLALTPEQTTAWQAFAGALEHGDVVVLLDRAARASVDIAAWLAAEPGSPAVRWCVPAVELARVGSAARLVDGLEAIADADWWAMIAGHDILLEWN